MNNRTTSSYIQFKKPFKLEGYKRILPAGMYKVEIEEELIEGLSFTALHRTQVRLHLHTDPKHPGTTEIMILDNPKSLEDALFKDKTMNENVIVKGSHSQMTQKLIGGEPSNNFDTVALERADNEGML